MLRRRRLKPFWFLRYPADRIREDVDDELRAHLEMRQEEQEARGLSPDEARKEALRQFGDIDFTRRYCRAQHARQEAAMRVGLELSELVSDVTNGFRQMRRSPGFTAVVVLTLALGIGANTALFSIFNSLLLRPLPVRDPASLALVEPGSWSGAVWNEFKMREQHLFAGAFAWAVQTFDLAAGGQRETVDGAYVSGRFFDVLGLSASRGRLLVTSDDGRMPDGPVAVISHRLWRQRYAGADDIVGRQLTVQRVPFTIVGVMPPDFFGPEVGRRLDVVLPLAAEPLVRRDDSQLADNGA